MTPDRLTLIEAIVERATRYLTDPPGSDDPVISLASPARLEALFADSVGLALADTTAAATDADLLAAVEQVIEYSMHTSHPRFVNQNFAGADPIAVVGDWLGAALNTTGATFEVAPVFTMMESAVLTKLGRLAGYLAAGAESLPSIPPGLFCAGGSMGTLFALQLARHRHQPDMTTAGANGDRLAIFVSEAGHYAAAKSASLMGIGTDAVIEVDSDGDGAIIPAELDVAIARAEADGRMPLAVIGTAGTTVTAAFDDLEALADICERRGLWFHVDGCYGGSALFAPEQAWRLRGVERSDSMVWNLHKMMGMTQQCSALLVKEPARLAACFSAGADYLFQSDKLHAEWDSGDRTFQCARRIDVLKLWLTWKARGDDGFAQRVHHAVEMADHTRRRIAGSDGAFVPVVSGDFTNVVFAWVPGHLRPLGLDDPRALPAAVHAELHALAPRIKARMQAEGSGMIGYQPVHGLNTFRMICMSPTLLAADVDALLAAIDAGGRALTNS
ncbi:MAG: pyridoxal-dependent decarboxylase [Acidimicrobiales bacterium]|nr:pyridoxal-dependent decarboxylase [Acidimicrobiales bacterium]